MADSVKWKFHEAKGLHINTYIVKLAQALNQSRDGVLDVHVKLQPSRIR